MARLAYIAAICISLVPMHTAAQRLLPQKIDCRQFANLHRINDSLYRSEQPSEAGIQYLDSIGVRSLLSIRSKSDSLLAKNYSFSTFHIPMKPEKFTQEEVIQALAIVCNAPKPLLIHCSRGADRTGLIIAAYRIVYCGWTKAQAIDEMRNGGYHFDQSLANMVRYLNAIDTAVMRKQIYEYSAQP